MWRGCTSASRASSTSPGCASASASCRPRTTGRPSPRPRCATISPACCAPSPPTPCAPATSRPGKRTTPCCTSASSRSSASCARWRRPTSPCSRWRCGSCATSPHAEVICGRIFRVLAAQQSRENRMKRAVCFLATVAFTVPLSFNAAAQEGTLKKIKDAGNITIGHRDASIPFSYYDDRQQVVGYAVDLCLRIVDAVKKEVGNPNLKVNYQLVTSANRIPLMANGTIDLECGSTTNNLARQEQVWFTITHFVTANRWVAKKSAKLHKLADLKGKTIVSTAGTTNIKQITEINGQQNLGMNIISANGHPEAFQMVETGRAVAFVMDDILLAGLAAQSRSPKDYEISQQGLSVEPYGIMLRKDDAAFKKVVDAAMANTYKSGAINGIYEKWFQKAVPPKGVNLNLPMSAAFKKVVAKPTDSGDPKDYE